MENKKEENKKSKKVEKIAKFEKVSFNQFRKSFVDAFSMYGDYNEYIKHLYKAISLPKRATKGSAGYDFYSPVDFSLKPGETIRIPTGIRARIEDGWVLAMFPRSGLGFKYRLQLDNTVGIIDSDYYNSDNEGHIFIKLTNDSKADKIVEIKAGQGVCQGIFFPFGITIDDETEGVRNGGFGSTTK